MPECMAIVLDQSPVDTDSTFAKFVSCKFELLNDPNPANDIAQCRQLSRISITTSVYFVVYMTQFYYFNKWASSQQIIINCYKLL